MSLVAVSFAFAQGCATTSNNSWDVAPVDAPSADVRDTGHSDATDVRTDAPADAVHADVHDTGTDVPHDTVTDTGTRVCPPSCTTDLDCQNMCPMPTPGSGTIFCCSFNTCVTLSGSTCPTGTDSGTGTDAFGFDVPTLDGFGGDGGGCLGTTCTVDSDCYAACGSTATCFGGFCI